MSTIKTGGNLVKQPNLQTTYTDEQLAEFVKCADPDTGPLYFMSNFFYIQHPLLGKALYEPYDFQKRLISVYHTNRFSVTMMPRQTGKSTSAAGYLLWYAMFIPDSTILVAAHKYLGAQEIMQRVRYAYESCPDHIRAGVISYNKGSIVFDNNSRIVSQTTTENTGRGMSITLLYCDEFAFVRPSIAKEFWTSITPTLSTGGKAIVTSTPNSDEDQFALIWKTAVKTEDQYGNPTELGQNGFKAFRTYWKEHPDRDEAWADQQRAILGVERFRREMDCEFIIEDETLIAPTKLIDLTASDPIYKTGQVRWFKEPVAKHFYIVTLDPSLGTGSDPAAIQIFDATTTEQIGEWRHNKTPIPMQVRILADICKHLSDITKEAKNIYFTVENNSIGEACLISIDEYGEEKIPGFFLSEPRSNSGGKRFRKGFNTTNRAKLAACSKLKNLIESDRLKIHSAGLITELKSFVARGASYSAKYGETDDLVSATLLVVRVMQVIQNYHPELDNQIRDHSDEIMAPLPFIALF